MHYVSSCATGRIVRLLVADVSGHGDSVAEVAGKLRALMRRHMNQADQRKLLTQINREFLGLSRLGQFATAVVISCWTPTGALTVSIAGHPSPLRFRAETGEWEPLFAAGEHANLPLGVDDAADFQQVRVRLEPDEMLLAFSDGLIESRDTEGRMLGQRGVIEMLNQLRARAHRRPHTAGGRGRRRPGQSGPGADRPCRGPAGRGRRARTTRRRCSSAPTSCGRRRRCWAVSGLGSGWPGGAGLGRAAGGGAGAGGERDEHARGVQRPVQSAVIRAAVAPLRSPHEPPPVQPPHSPNHPQRPHRPHRSVERPHRLGRPAGRRRGGRAD
ncbi:MAG: serine/threonine-protein phosphatase [Planctomycetota bacterium]|nr:MAG: serine/threonine-protein phosphatase [Planctomycetota bacterium]